MTTLPIVFSSLWFYRTLQLLGYKQLHGESVAPFPKKLKYEDLSNLFIQNKKDTSANLPVTVDHNREASTNVP